MESHSVTCQPTQVNTPRLNPSQTNWYSICLHQRDGRLSWPRWPSPGPEISRVFELIGEVRRYSTTTTKQLANVGYLVECNLFLGVFSVRQHRLIVISKIRVDIGHESSGIQQTVYSCHGNTTINRIIDGYDSCMYCTEQQQRLGICLDYPRLNRAE